jgi:hypothetical protein
MKNCLPARPYKPLESITRKIEGDNMSITESRIEAESLQRLTQIVRIPEGLDYPAEVKKRLKAQKQAVGTWSKAQIAKSDARAALDNQKLSEDAAMRAAAREGLEDPRKPEDIEMLTRIVEFATVQEEEARQFANSAGLKLREVILEKRAEMLELVTNLFRESYASYKSTIEQIETDYMAAKNNYRESSNTVNLLLRITEGYNPKLGGEERGLELPKFEASGKKSLNILHSFRMPQSIEETKSPKAQNIDKPSHVVHIGHFG